MNRHMILHCCGCNRFVSARLTTGSEVYPNNLALKGVPFWRCDTCGNWVGCHHKTSQPTRPLGCIPTPKLKELRRQIHHRLDPLWNYYGLSRKDLYAMLSGVLGREYHTASLRSVAEAEAVLKAVNDFREAYEAKARQAWHERHGTPFEE